MTYLPWPGYFGHLVAGFLKLFALERAYCRADSSGLLEDIVFILQQKKSLI
jgi:hypothetical protein